MPVWFVLDGDDLVLTTGRDTVKGRDLRRDGRVSVVVDDDHPPFAFVHLRGRARVTEGDARPARTGRPASPPATWARSGRTSTAGATRSPTSCWFASPPSG